MGSQLSLDKYPQSLSDVLEIDTGKLSRLKFEPEMPSYKNHLKVYTIL